MYIDGYIYCSIGTYLSERTMKEFKGGEHGRDLLSIMKGSIIHITKRGPYHKRQYGNDS